MKRCILLLLLMYVTILFVGCSSDTGESATDNEDVTTTEVTDEGEIAVYHQMSQEDAYEKMQEEGVVVLDVRTQSEYDEVHIPGATLYTLDTIDDSFMDAYPDKDLVLLVYCRSGNRSRQASNILVDMGYTNVYDFGGITSWPYETE